MGKNRERVWETHGTEGRPHRAPLESLEQCAYMSLRLFYTSLTLLSIHSLIGGGVKVDMDHAERNMWWAQNLIFSPNYAYVSFIIPHHCIFQVHPSFTYLINSTLYMPILFPHWLLILLISRFIYTYKTSIFPMPLLKTNHK